MTEEQIKEEIQKCKDSPYYFAVTYLRYVDGTHFHSHLTELEFNKRFKDIEELGAEAFLRKRYRYGST